MPERSNCLIKLCGMNQPWAVEAANELTPDFIGIVVDYPKSPRSVPPARAAQLARLSRVPVVVVIVEPNLAAVSAIVESVRPNAIQLSGNESPDFVAELGRVIAGIEIWKVVHLPPAPSQDEVSRAVAETARFANAGAAKLLLDTRAGNMPGGSGTVGSWDAAAALIAAAPIPVLLAGGLTPQNVAEAMRKARPLGVDVSGGTESAPGIKSPELMKDFVLAARAFVSNSI